MDLKGSQLPEEELRAISSAYVCVHVREDDRERHKEKESLWLRACMHVCVCACVCVCVSLHLLKVLTRAC